MTNFEFTAVQLVFICNVAGITTNIGFESSTTIDVDTMSSSELLILARGVVYGLLTCSDEVGFTEHYTGILGDISSGGTGGTVSPEQIQDTVAEMFEDGILITSTYDDVAGKIQLTPVPGVFIKEFVDNTYSAVSIDGGLITPTGGVNFSLAEGSGYARNTALDEIVFVEWSAGNGACLYNGNNFIGINYLGAIVISNSQLGPEHIALGYINTAFSNTTVTGYSNIHLDGKDGLFWINQWVRNAVGANIEFGCNISMLPSPNELSAVLGSGKVWAQFSEINVLDNYNFTKIYGTAVGFIPNTLNPNVIDVNYINDRNQAPGSALLAMTPGYFKKDLFFMNSEGSLYYLYATSEWPTLEEAISAPLPDAPSAIKAQIIRLAGVVVQQGATTVSDLIDIRPMFSKIFETGTSAIPSTAVSHNDLLDLGVDSHGQYHTDARGDARYNTKSEITSFLSGKSDTGHGHTNATTIADGFMSSADKTKLDGIATSATANQADAYLLSRSNHTGTQSAATITGLTSASVGLGNVDNTSDANKPISTATQTALNGKSDNGHAHAIADVTGLQTALNSKEATVTAGTTAQYYRGDKSWQTLDGTAVGLGAVVNADTTTTANITDSTNKRFVSDAQLTVVGNTSNTNTGDETQATIKTKLGAATTLVDGYLTSINFNTFNNKEPALAVGTTAQYYRGDKSWQTLNKASVGLTNADDTSDANKPISTATQTALNGKEGTITPGTTAQYYRGDKSWQTLNSAAVGLGNADNTSDVNKPVSTATQAALDGKEATITAGTTGQYWRGDKSWQTLNSAAVGLGNADNTSDVNKPISIATQTALNLKIDTVANAGGGAGILKDVTGTTLNLKTIVGDGSVEITTGTDLISLSSRHAKHPQNPYITQFDDFAIAQTAFFLQTNAAGAGSGVTQNGQPVFGGADKRFGIKTCNTGTTTTGYAGLYGINTFFNFGNLTDGDYVEFSTSLRVPVLSDATNRYTIYFGFTDQTTSTEAVDGAYFKYSDNLSGGAIQYVTSNNSTRTATSTGVTLVADTDYTLRVRVSNIRGTISAAFYIDGVEIAAGVTTNLPITSLRTTSVGMYIGKSAGNTNRAMEVDWVYFEYKTSRNITL